MPDIDFPSRNTVLQLLREAQIEPAEVADALAAYSRAAGVMASAQFGVGQIPLDTAQQVAADFVFTAAEIEARLGARAGELQLELVRSSPARRRMIAAVHEASHATALFACGIPVTMCSIDPADLAPGDEGVTRSSGEVEFLLAYAGVPEPHVREDMEPLARRVAAACLAGPLGEGSFFRSRFPAYWTDLGDARDICRKFAPQGADEQMLLQSHRASERIVQVTRRGIAALSRALDERGRLTGSEVEALLRERLAPERLRPLAGVFGAAP